MGRAPPPQFSPDRRWWWNGRAWVLFQPKAAPTGNRPGWLVPAAIVGGLVLVLWTANLLPSQNAGSPSGGGSPNANVALSTSPSPSSSPSPNVDPEADPSASPPQTVATLPPPRGPAACGDPHAHVYSPDRLQLLAPCVTVTGTVAIIRTEKDGDLHVLLRLDPGQDKYINATNVSAESGLLVLEPVCVNTPTQADAIPACAGYKNPLPIPEVGTHVSVTGAWVHDLDHGWLELHPVFAFNGVGAPVAAPSPAATPIPAPTPSTAPPPPPVVNLCGAPANPWNYNFCGGNLITAPATGFCSYFTCISSFATGTGYVVQCVDGKFSKSGGHTGVCSQHGGFSRNLYSP